MLITKIILENYGLYSGRVEFDLKPKLEENNKKNIILIGGKNGVGKTTLLEALRLGFYGKSILGNRVSQKEYESFLNRQIHKNKNAILANSYARIAIDFNHVSMGQYKSYTVERSWQIEHRKVKEYLKIFTDGNLESNVTADYWKGFIEDIIPERLSNLFFFDGEKIQEIAQNTSNNTVLGDAIKTLLGLDIIERLKADLNIYKTRELKSNSLNNFKKRWEEIDSTIKTLKTEISQKLESLAKLRAKIDGNLSDIRNWEKKLHSEGGHFALQRESLKQEKNELFNKCNKLEETVKDECTKLLPFALCPTINNLLREQVKKELELTHQKIIKNKLKDIHEGILSALKDINSMKQTDRIKLTKRINSLMTTKTTANFDLKNAKTILHFSENSANTNLKMLDKAEKETAPTVDSACIDLEITYAKLRAIEKDLAKSPDDNQIQPFFEELSLLNQRQGELKSQERQIENELNKKEYELKIYQSNLNKLIDKQKVHNQIQDRIKKIKTIEIILNEYYEKVTKAKIQQLNESFSFDFNQLMNKQLVKKIQIDPETFDVSLFTDHDIPVNKNSLSSGERQLFAIAMLWSLAKTSGRPLPIIIDTPLGRLDSNHRNSLINSYFPNASHQVIILSTDTEVDQDLYRELKPYLSHCYHLEYDNMTKSTKPKSGYFWRKKYNA